MPLSITQPYSPSIKNVAVVVGSHRRGSINRKFAESVGKLSADRLCFQFIEIGTCLCSRRHSLPFVECDRRGGHAKNLGSNSPQINYSGTMTALSFGIASYTALSMFRWAITSSGGVCDSHSESDRSWYRFVFSM
jgi:hypothetical protein